MHFPLSSDWPMLIRKKKCLSKWRGPLHLPLHYMTPGLKDTFYGHFLIWYCFNLLPLSWALYFLSSASIFISNTATKRNMNGIRKLSPTQAKKTMLVLHIAIHHRRLTFPYKVLVSNSWENVRRLFMWTAHLKTNDI